MCLVYRQVINIVNTLLYKPDALLSIVVVIKYPANTEVGITT
jgi:hypothetical protein